MPTDVLVDGELLLYGTVGDDAFGDGFAAMDVVQALATLGRNADVTVRINSAGGVVTEGIAIHAALAAHRGTVTVVVDAIAASAASIIAMAGAEIVMRRGALMMIHDPATLTWGDAGDHRDSLAALEATARAMAEIYAERSGASPSECRAAMAATTWMTAEEAVAAGFASRIDGAAADPPDRSAYAWRALAHGNLRLVAGAGAAGRAPRHAQPQEPTMTETAKPEPCKGDATNPAAPPATATQAAPSATEIQAQAAEIARLCTAAGAPSLIAGLITAGASVAEAKTRIDWAKEIRAQVGIAKRSLPELDAGLADQFIAAGTPLDKVTSDLFGRLTAAQERTPIQSSHQARGGEGAANPAAIDVAKIYATHNAPITAARR